MTKQTELFDKKEGERLKEEGRDLAAWDKGRVLELARLACLQAARGRVTRTATADDAYHWLVEKGYPSAYLGNAAGHLFTGGNWEFTGRWVKSERVSNHARMIRVWSLKA